jgi:hypothetical protein
MNIRKHTLGMLGMLLAGISAAGLAVAADRPYTEGAVVIVASIRTEPGQFDEYMAWLGGQRKQIMDAQKAAGVIVDYSVYTVTPRGLDDPDIYLVTVYKNMAALDGLDEKTDAIYQKTVGDLSQQNAASIARGKLRTQLGSQMLREIKLK